MKLNKHYAFLIYLLAVACATPPQSPAIEELMVFNYWDYEPSWSPNGERIVFCSTRASHPTLNIFSMQRDGTDIQQLTFTSEGYGNSFPAYSPDGKEIAFIGEREGQRDLFIMNSDGTEIRNLTDDAVRDGDYLCFSSDGRKIFTNRNVDGNRDIYTVEVASGAIERITKDPGSDRAPYLSPDGRHMAFETSRFAGNSDIAIMDLKTREITQLTESWADDGGCSFGPDAKEVFFYSNRDDSKYEVYAVSVETKNVRRVTDSHNWDLDARVAPDGSIAFQSSRIGRWGIVVIDGSTGKRLRLTNNTTTPFMSMVEQEDLTYALTAYEDSLLDSLRQQYYFEEELIALSYDLWYAGRREDAKEVIDFASQNDRWQQIGSVRASLYADMGLGAPLDQPAFFSMTEREGVSVASTYFDEMKKKYPNWQYLAEWELNMFAYYHHATGRYEDAVRLFQISLDLYPNSIMAHHDIANSYKQLGDLEAAVLYHQKAVAIDSADWYGKDSMKELALMAAE